MFDLCIGRKWRTKTVWTETLCSWKMKTARVGRIVGMRSDRVQIIVAVNACNMHKTRKQHIVQVVLGVRLATIDACDLNHTKCVKFCSLPHIHKFAQSAVTTIDSNMLISTSHANTCCKIGRRLRYLERQNTWTPIAGVQAQMKVHKAYKGRKNLYSTNFQPQSLERSRWLPITGRPAKHYSVESVERCYSP